MISPEKIRLATITCSDRRMDIIDTNYLLDTPINKYDVRCVECKFPDIDSTPDLYYLAKNRVFSGIEIMEADLGNLFVSDRLKKVFEILFPDDCDFRKTYIQGTTISTKWWLAIPKNTIISGEVENSITRCKKCNEPLYAHPGTQYKFWVDDFEGDSDIIKSHNWHSRDEKDWKRSWIGRDIYLSVRLISLLKKIQAKGIYQQSGSKYTALTKSEKEWVESAIGRIGLLATNFVRKDIAAVDLSKLMKHFGLRRVNYKNVEFFEKKFKIKPAELVKVLCSVEKSIVIHMGVNETYKLADIKNWEMTKGNKRLINFAFDDFGNSLQFDAKDKFCPIYYYDHETFIYEMTHSSILSLIR